MNEHLHAEQIVWEAPGGVQMSLAPEAGGTLQVDVREGVVTVTGKQCRHSQGEAAKKPKDVASQVLADVHMTIIGSLCQITWKARVKEP
jgi:hypothetical protein